MPSLLKTKKGVETAPLFIAFSAIVVLITVAIMLPELNKWNAINDKAKTLYEARKLAAACDEVLKMGDSGSVEEVHVDVPRGCCLRFTDPIKDYYGSIFSYCNIPNEKFEPIETETNASLKSRTDNNEICGTSVDVIIAYGEEDNSIPDGSYIIYVSERLNLAM
jgi:hypothetical protein